MPSKLTPAEEAAEIRAQLDDIGQRRQAMKDEDEVLREETANLLRRARGIVPMAEASRRAGLNRSTVYELYLGDEDGNESGTPAGQRGSRLAS